MPPIASQIFRLRELREGCELIAYEIACQSFSALRRNLRVLIDAMQAEDPESPVLHGVKHLLLTWLTAPVPFGDFDPAPIARMGTPDSIGRQWGTSAREAFVRVERGLHEIRIQQSPLRVALNLGLIRELEGLRSVLIYCHRSEEPYFKSLEGWKEDSIGAARFIHSWREYRDIEPFDVLIHVGPLRSHGYSALPGAVLNAPRQAVVLQYVWNGLRDQDGFGLDPVLLRLGQYAEQSALRVATTQLNKFGTAGGWTRRTVVIGSDSTRVEESLDDLDEIDLYRRAARQAQSRNAVVVQISSIEGVPYAPQTQVMALLRGEASTWSIEQIVAFRTLSRRLPRSALYPRH